MKDKNSSFRKGETMKKIETIRQHWGKLPYAEIGKMVGMTADAVRKMGRRDGLEPVKVNVQNRTLTTEQEIERDVKVGSLDKRLKKTDDKYRHVLKENENLQAQIDAIKVVSDANSYTIKTKSGGTLEATAVVVASDWHWAETVHTDNVNNLNEFNTSIAKARAEKFFANTVKLLSIFQVHSRINTLVLALLGDFINGELREESMQNNGELTMDELLGVQEMLLSGIKYILDNTKVDLIIPCHSGNHGRVTKKIHVATEAGNSLEYVMYHMLARAFKDEKRVKFIIPTSYHSFLDVSGYTIRFSHGHAIRYAGGVGGIFIPCKKAIAQWNKARHADLDVFGHFHQTRDGGDFICNGSLIGWNEFANFIKADFEKPKQVFFLIDHDRKEKTVTAPIFLT
jgi:hypothetical protein